MIFHTLNDHHRPWWMDHQSLTCRLNRVADLAADEAARWEGVDSKGIARPRNHSFGAFAEGRLNPPKTGGPVTLSRNRIVLGGDFRKAIRDGLNYKLTNYLGANTVQGSTARRVMLEVSDVKASIEVRNILPDYLYETVLRSLLYRERYTASEIKAKYREIQQKSETIFSRLGGALSKLCPFCAHLGRLKIDNYRHGRFFCRHPAMVTAREHCDAMFGARVTAEGLCWKAFPGDRFKLGSEKLDGAPPRRPIPSGERIRWIQNKDEAILKSPGIADVIVSGTRIRCLSTVLSEAGVPGQSQAETMARALRYCLENKNDNISPRDRSHHSSIR